MEKSCFKHIKHLREHKIGKYSDKSYYNEVLDKSREGKIRPKKQVVHKKLFNGGGII